MTTLWSPAGRNLCCVEQAFNCCALSRCLYPGVDVKHVCVDDYALKPKRAHFVHRNSLQVWSTFQSCYALFISWRLGLKQHGGRQV